METFLGKFKKNWRIDEKCDIVTKKVRKISDMME